MYRCVSVSCLSLLGGRGRSRDVVQAGFEAGYSAISPPSLGSLEAKHFLA